MLRQLSIGLQTASLVCVVLEDDVGLVVLREEENSSRSDVTYKRPLYNTTPVSHRFKPKNVTEIEYSLNSSYMLFPHSSYVAVLE